MSEVAYKPFEKISKEPTSFISKVKDGDYYTKLFSEHGERINLHAVCDETNMWKDLYVVPQEYTLFITSFSCVSTLRISFTSTAVFNDFYYSRYKGKFLCSHYLAGDVGISQVSDKCYHFPIKVKSGEYISNQCGLPSYIKWSMTVEGYLVETKYLTQY